MNYDGLRKKKTYDEHIDYVMNKQEKLQYPDRAAKFLRNSPQLSNLLDSNGEGLLEMEEQQKRQVMEVEKRTMNIALKNLIYHINCMIIIQLKNK